ncbi:MAG: MBL fold metallo-hydrolase [Nevskia sp.]|nr:MBL fold metallo-hydrolase [Nevskia sp.]
MSGGRRKHATAWTIGYLAVAVLACSATAMAAPGCGGEGVALQVLGSGGPELQDRRASSSYLVWRDGKARVLVDAGGGSALRFGEAGAQVADLEVVLLSHLHVDHTADLAALIKSSYFEERTRPLPVYGPPGNAGFPATTAFVAALFDPARGAYRYLGDFVAGREDGYRLQAHDVHAGPHEIRAVFAEPGLAVSATPVIHGTVPALAYRVEVDGRSIVFSGDGNGDNGNLEKLARGADLLVVHNAIPEDLGGAARALHMPPSVIGRIARDAGVKQLVLSHRMLRTLGRERETQELVGRSYAGAVSFADDLECFQ